MSSVVISASRPDGGAASSSWVMIASPNAVGSVDDLSVFHPDDTARFIGHRGVVSAGDNGDAKGGTQVAQHAHHRLPRTVVEIGRLLVCEDNRRIADQQPRH